jgi:hypothetical protein
MMPFLFVRAGYLAGLPLNEPVPNRRTGTPEPPPWLADSS